jgi:hypothetical protein
LRYPASHRKNCLSVPKADVIVAALNFSPVRAFDSLARRDLNALADVEVVEIAESGSRIFPGHRYHNAPRPFDGIVRARCKIGMTNLAYNMRHFVCLEGWPRPGEPARSSRCNLSLPWSMGIGNTDRSQALNNVTKAD